MKSSGDVACVLKLIGLWVTLGLCMCAVVWGTLYAIAAYLLSDL